MRTRARRWLDRRRQERFRALGLALAEKGYVVANVEYRLAGAAKYPAAVQDCSLAVRWVRANAARFGLDPKRIGAWGGSAGGHLVGLLAAAPQHERFLTAELKDVSAAVQATCIMAGPTDLTNATFVESLRKAKEKSNSYTWFGKLYDDAPLLPGLQISIDEGDARLLVFRSPFSTKAATGAR